MGWSHEPTWKWCFIIETYTTLISKAEMHPNPQHMHMTSLTTISDLGTPICALYLQGLGLQKQTPPIQTHTSKPNILGWTGWPPEWLNQLCFCHAIWGQLMSALCLFSFPGWPQRRKKISLCPTEGGQSHTNVWSRSMGSPQQNCSQD